MFYVVDRAVCREANIYRKDEVSLLAMESGSSLFERQTIDNGGWPTLLSVSMP
jgi:hypothetical protein